jgi:hypothetical protein
MLLLKSKHTFKTQRLYIHCHWTKFGNVLQDVINARGRGLIVLTCISYYVCRVAQKLHF